MVMIIGGSSMSKAGGHHHTALVHTCSTPTFPSRQGLSSFVRSKEEHRKSIPFDVAVIPELDRYRSLTKSREPETDICTHGSLAALDVRAQATL